ncbi:MAG TPA: hypothetical protein VGH32_07460 [Pirellulales bacterium]
MLARSAQQISPAATPAWHAAFIEMPPKIHCIAKCAFRRVRSEQRDDLVCEALASATRRDRHFWLDLAECLKRLPEPLRELALVLASGETTSAAAQKFQVSPGRVAQFPAWQKRN